jgi:serine/threonine protein phosphatase PrpC
MLDLIFGQASNSGKLRRENEDAMGVFVPESPRQTRLQGWMFVVADGIGGLDFGDVASKAAVAAMEAGFAAASAGSSLVTLLPDLIQRANSAVHDEMLVPARRGKLMGTTVVACALRQNQAVVSHVGDSRCYHIRGGRAVAITNDHSVGNEQRNPGSITEEEQTDSGMNHALTRSLGMERFVLVDTATFSIETGDMLVLCTDGLHRAMYESDIARIASKKGDIQEIAEALNRYAIEADGSDNSTVQVISIQSIENMGLYRGRPYRIMNS